MPAKYMKKIECPLIKSQIIESVAVAISETTKLFKIETRNLT